MPAKVKSQPVTTIEPVDDEDINDREGFSQNAYHLIQRDQEFKKLVGGMTSDIRAKFGIYSIDARQLIDKKSFEPDPFTSLAKDSND